MSKNITAAISLDELADRIVPAASVLDLTTPAAEAAAGEAIVRQADARPTGTGFIHSFVRVQGKASGGGSQHGYNTDARPLQFDENKSPQFTRGLLASQVPTVMEDGVAYREFLLDINQKSSAAKLSLDEVRIFLGGVPDLSGYSTSTHTLPGAEQVFDLDAHGDVAVLLNARLNSGSGAGDMVLLVPAAAFAGADPASHVYLYSKMGSLPGAAANGGFEEWAVGTSGGETASGGTGSIAGSVWVDHGQDGIRDGTDYGIGGVTITLQGVNDLGQTVVLTTATADDGSYSFAGLRDGTYTLLQTQPEDYTDGTDFIGSLGGDLFETDGVINIHLSQNAAGTGYDFTEYLDFVPT